MIVNCQMLDVLGLKVDEIVNAEMTKDEKMYPDGKVKERALINIHSFYEGRI